MANKSPRTIGPAERGQALVFAGPFPPPTHGQALCTQVLADKIANHGIPLHRIDLSVSGSNPAVKSIAKLSRHLQVVAAAADVETVYLSANSNAGMWITAAAAGLLRTMGKRLMIHHHAYDHIRRRRPNMVALARAGGPEAIHIVLGEAMARELRANTPEVKATFVLNNAGLVDSAIRPSPGRKPELVLGHLSNLNKDKGIAQVVALAQHLVQMRQNVRLVVAGPTSDAFAHQTLQSAATLLGDKFTYLGPVADQSKLQFFDQITHFVFPTRYRNEASPLVLLEAMAAGIPCIATDIGCIRDDVGDAGGIVVPLARDFVAEATAFIATAVPDAGAMARAQFDKLLDAHERQLRSLMTMLDQPPGR